MLVTLMVRPAPTAAIMSVISPVVNVTLCGEELLVVTGGGKAASTVSDMVGTSVDIGVGKMVFLNEDGNIRVKFLRSCPHESFSRT